jgi:hypothetical protein
MSASPRGWPFSRQRLQDEITLWRFLGRKPNRRSGPNAQAGQSGPPRHHDAAEKDFVGQALARELNDYQRICRNFCCGGTEENSIGMFRTVETLEFFCGLAPDS